MRKVIVGIGISLGLSAALYFGGESLHQFAYYVKMTMAILALLVILSGGVKGEAAQTTRGHVWVNTVSTGISLAALIATGHPGLAAFEFVLSALIVGMAFSEKAKDSEVAK